MEVSQQDRLQFLEDQRKLQMAFDDHRLDQENDRRAQQLLRSQALRERWLLEGPSPTGPEPNYSRTTENQRTTISRLEQDVMCPGAGASTVTEVKGHRAGAEEMKRALYSVQITVERDWLTGQTKVLSTNTTLPFDPEHQAIKVYEDELKVVHEVNGVDGFHQLSSSEVEDLIHKADEVSLMTSADVPQPKVPQPEIPVSEAPLSEVPVSEAPLPKVPVSEPPVPKFPVSAAPLPKFPVSEVPGLKVPGLQEDQASMESPVSMVFMGYHSVEDEDETMKVLGLQGTARAELVLIEEETTPPGPEVSPSVAPQRQKVAPTVTPQRQEVAPTVTSPEQEIAPSVTPPGQEVLTTVPASSAPPDIKAANTENRAIVKKEKPRKCCSIM